MSPESIAAARRRRESVLVTIESIQKDGGVSILRAGNSDRLVEEERENELYCSLTGAGVGKIECKESRDGPMFYASACASAVDGELSRGESSSSRTSNAA